ncbi:MAG: hypothetical protein LBG84_01545 [Treponema sp.]|nr:hypothetical protein [Treponema sp.]
MRAGDSGGKARLAENPVIPPAYRVPRESQRVITDLVNLGADLKKKTPDGRNLLVLYLERGMFNAAPAAAGVWSTITLFKIWLD